uniref:Uncharacterized protein n=1 Tax=Sinocyclocheilus anshuiensis TaxID=1608454 RepID=A0A671SWU8_9TELE
GKHSSFYPLHVLCRRSLAGLRASSALLETLCFSTYRRRLKQINCDAIEAIITYSQDAEELLRRKKVHRDVIFKYLANEGVAMLPNSEKQQLIRRTVEYWSSGEDTGPPGPNHCALNI